MELILTGYNVERNDFEAIEGTVHIALGCENLLTGERMISRLGKLDSKLTGGNAAAWDMFYEAIHEYIMIHGWDVNTTRVRGTKYSIGALRGALAWASMGANK